MGKEQSCCATAASKTANASSALPANFINPPGSSIDQILKDIPIPRMIRIQQTFERPKLADPVQTFLDNLKASRVMEAVKPGMSIAVTGGSRGITNLPQITKVLLDELKAAGAKPFLFPAMGSHGGATPKGQLGVLERMGFTEESMGVPIRATMDVVEVGRTPEGLPACLDAIAAASDGIVVVNRIKPHTSFRGAIESGLVKMVVIGVGKQKGAEICHNLGFERMEENLLILGRTLLATGKILFGVGLIENAFHETCNVPVLAGRDFMDKEPALLTEARRLMPRLPVLKLDVLVLDEIGKEISGAGLDPNILGRYSTASVPLTDEDARITRVAVLDITKKSDGNGNGLGLCDCTTERALKKFNFVETYPNLLTATTLVSAKIPVTLANDRQCIQAAIKTCLIGDPRQVRMARIKNTLSLDSMEISENLVEEATARPNVTVTGKAEAIPFKEDGNLF